MTTPLFLLRCTQIGLAIRDLDLLTVGMVLDMYTESGNDEYYRKDHERDHVRMATQGDFDAF